MKAKVIMLETKKATWPNLIWLGRISKQLRLDISYNDNPKSINPIDDSMLPQNIYLIDESAEIKEKGTWMYSSLLNTIDQYGRIPRFMDKWSKIIASTDNTINHKDSDDEILGRCQIPYLSEQSIKLLIDYYNKNGKMPDEVEIEIVARLKGYPKYEIKLNSQGTIDINIPKEKFINDNL